MLTADGFKGDIPVVLNEVLMTSADQAFSNELFRSDAKFDFDVTNPVDNKDNDSARLYR